MTHPKCFEEDMESLDKISKLLPKTEVPLVVEYGELKPANKKAQKAYKEIFKEVDKIIACTIMHCLEETKEQI